MNMFILTDTTMLEYLLEYAQENVSIHVQHFFQTCTFIYTDR